MKEFAQTDKADVVNAVLKYLMRKNFTSIAANKSNFHKPTMIKGANKNAGYRPDFTANLKGTMHVFEIETNPKSFNADETIDKWKLFSSYASDKGGAFYLVILTEHEKEVADVLKQKKIDAGILQVAPK